MGLGAGGGLGDLSGFGAMPGLGQGQGGDMASLMQVLLPSKISMYRALLSAARTTLNFPGYFGGDGTLPGHVSAYLWLVIEFRDSKTSGLHEGWAQSTKLSNSKELAT